MSRIKRGSYKSIYSTRRRRRGGGGVFKYIVITVLLAALVFVGYSITDPLKKLFSGQWKVPSSSTPSSSASSSKPGSSSSGSGSSSGSSSAPVATVSTRGVFLPKKYLSDSAALDTLITQSKAAKINLAVVELKGADGIVNYASKLTEIQSSAAIPANAPDAAAAAAKLSAAGITPAARIYAFQDPVAPTVMRGTGVMYGGNHTINWLDQSGARWLNPYNAQAQQYIIDLAKEAVSLGYKEIFIDGLTFPNVGSPDSTGYYGDSLPTKEQCIAAFTLKIKQAVNASGGKLSVVMPGNAAIGQAAPNMGQSQDIFSLSGDNISPMLCPSLLNQTGLAIGSTTVVKADLSPASTVGAMAQYIKSADGAKISTALPFIQAYTNTALGAGNYKQYTADDINGEAAALKAAGIPGFILYNPDGTYDLSSIK